MTMIRKSALAALLAALALPVAAVAADCEVVIESNDAMQFDTKEIVVDRSCEDFTVNLKHVGKLPANAMGHNWVLTHEDDMKDVATDGAAAGLDNDYVKEDDDRVIAHTKVIGGGEETSVTFNVADMDQDEEYGFLCSFPGHWANMQGKLTFDG